MTIGWIQATERLVGRSGSYSDTLNRALRDFITSCGGDPDATTFSGYRGPVYNVKAYGALGNGSADDTDAVIDAIAAMGTTSGRRLYFPAGNYVISDELRFLSQYVAVEGEGQVTTTITFAPTVSGKRLFKFQLVAATQLFGVEVRNLTVIAAPAAAALQKIAFEFVDTGETLVENVNVTDFSGSNGGAVDANGMYTTPSTGFLVKGRERLTLRNVIVEADRPIHIADNPNHASLNCDHMHVTDYYGLCTDPNGAHVVIDATLHVTTVTFDGSQAWVLGKYGIFKKDADGTSARSYQVAVKNVRAEQFTAGGYLCYWTGNVSALSFDNCQPAIEGGGWRVRYAQVLLLNNSLTTNTAGVNIDIDSTVVACSGRGNDWADSSTFSLGTNIVHMQSPRSSVKNMGESFVINAASPFTALSLTSPLIATPTLSGLLKMSDALARIRGGATGVAIRKNDESADNFTVLDSGACEARASMKATQYFVGANNVVGTRDTGWTAMTGAVNKATVYDTTTVTLAQLASRVAALQSVLTGHGLIGA